MSENSDHTPKLIVIASNVSLFICGICILTQIYIHRYVVPKFHDMFFSMEYMDLPGITKIIMNYSLLFQTLFTVILILMILKESYIKDKALCSIINLGYLIIFFVHIGLVTMAIFGPIMAMQKAAMGD
ncbi:MAG: hypothetical protein COA79_24600 [Planctomycetota bacterium]|nr:MAG: hypothetical protein COA79_24600 [Planctomycetota bacterium]